MGRRTGVAAAGLAALALVVGVAGCGEDEPGAGAPTSAVTAAVPAPAAGTMLAGAGLSVAEALAADPGTTIVVRAFLVVEAGDARLCDLLLESYPPGCGGPAMAVTGLPPELVAGLTSEGDRRWSDGPVQLAGAVRDGVFVNDPMALAAG